MNKKEILPVNVQKLITDKAEIAEAMRKYIIANNCTQEFAYECVLQEVQEYVPDWNPYKNFQSFVASQTKKVVKSKKKK